MTTVEHACLSVLALLAATATSAADPRLTLTHEPPPRHLRMRPRVVAQAGAAVSSATPMPAAPPPVSIVPSADDEGVVVRDLRQSVSFNLDLGYQVESASPSGRHSLGGRQPISGQDYAALRSYGFGEAFGSTRGLGLASLSTYFAARFQAVTKLRFTPAGENEVAVAPPIASWFERSGVEVRYGWAEVRDFLPARWGLSKLRFRAGSQHVYGPWMMHLDGAMLAYDGPILTAAMYSGIRHSDYTRDQSDKRPGVFGTSMRFDLRGLPTPVPIALQSEFLAIGESTEAQQPASRSAVLQGDWRPRRDVAMIGQFRFLDNGLPGESLRAASQRLEVRARYKQVTNLVFDVMHRTSADWRWDPSLVAPDANNDPTVARRYLDLGPVVPQFVGSVRAGTLIAENVDLFVRGAFSADGSSDDAPQSAYSAPYLELASAVEIRVRRQVAFGASLLTRNTSHLVLDQPVEDQRNSPQMLPAAASRGDDGFTEAGASLKMTLGARRFSTLFELYGRRSRYAQIYVDPLLPIPVDDLRIGGRITLDAWVGTRMRLFAAYDVSSAIDLYPEISGYRSLRLMMSGAY